MKIRFFLAATALLLATLLSPLHTSVHAQDGNLLTNGGFEGNYAQQVGEQPVLVASGWQTWFQPRQDGDPYYLNTQPRYVSSTQAQDYGITPRARTGVAQTYYSFYSAHNGGLYQTIRNIPAGAELRFSVYGYIWSSTYSNPSKSEEPAGVSFRVGIDPTGGTNPLADTVVYSDPAVFYDTFRQYAIIATADSTSVTVFIRSEFAIGVANTAIFVDDAVLEFTPGQNLDVTQVAQNTVVPTTIPATSTFTAVPASPTAVPPSVTASSVPSTTVLTQAPVSTAVPVVSTLDPSDATPTSETDDDLDATAVPTQVATSAPPTATQATATVPISDEFPGTVVYTVARGDTVGRLATLYGSTVFAIISANGLNSAALIYVGQSLVIPVRILPMTDVPSATPQVPNTPVPTVVSGGTSGGVTGTQPYVVQRGDNLTAIAQRFNTTPATLVQLNGIANPNRIFAGQTLNVPQAGITAPAPTAAPSAPPVAPQQYVVQRGDTLYALAIRFGVNVRSIAEANNIFNYNRIFVGQSLTIPAQ